MLLRGALGLSPVRPYLVLRLLLEDPRELVHAGAYRPTQTARQRVRHPGPVEAELARPVYVSYRQLP